MNEIEKLRAQLKALADEHAKLTAKYDDLTDEERARLDEIDAEYEAGEKKLKALQRSASLKASLGQSAGRAVPGQQPSGEPRITGGESVLEQDPRRGFRSLGEFANSVMRACRPGGDVDQRLKPDAAAATTYANEGSGADGGYSVPPEFRREIWKVVYETGSVLAAANPIPTTSNSVQIASTEQTPWGANGVRAYWTAEAGAGTQNKPVLKDVNVQLHKLLVLVPATNELLADSPMMGNLLTQLAGEAIRWKADDAIVNGDGVGKPLGIMQSAATVEQAKEAAQAADTIVSGNIVKMYGRMAPGGRQGAVWLISPDAVNQLPLLTVGNKPIWTPPNEGLKQAPMGFLLGLPVVETHACQTLGDDGDIILASLRRGYASFSNGGVQFDESIHLFFDYDETALRWKFRLGGQPYLKSAISPANGSTTLSHFVKLADRA